MTMNRRDALAMTVASAAGAMAATSAPAQTGREPQQLSLGLERYVEPFSKPDANVPDRVNVARVPDAYAMPGRFAGKTVLVTGCARGMGQAAALRLAREGANVVGVDILEEVGAKTIAAINAEGGKAVFVGGDISRNAVCEEMVRVCVRTYGGLDAALNNAGVTDALRPDEAIDYVSQRHRVMAPLHQAGDDYWLRTMEVNATGTFYSMRHEIRQMMNQGRGGSIVNVSSVAGLIGFGGTSAYVASKHAVNGLTRSAAVDYAPFGIRINSVCMHTTETPMYERGREILNQRGKTGYKDTGIGLAKIFNLLQYSDEKKRGSTPAEQAAVMLFLLSPESSYITGATYQTDGGFVTI
jgi:NAD(P)-dependent dehydrogenase (short-subunit alcohol dehydrogenase family)